MTQLNEQAFEESEKAVQKGSKIIVWSEGLGISMIDDKDDLIEKGKTLIFDGRLKLFRDVLNVYNDYIITASNFTDNFDEKIMISNIKYPCVDA